MSTCWHGREDLCPICRLISSDHEEAVKINGKGKHELESNRYRPIKSSGIPIEAAEKDFEKDN